MEIRDYIDLLRRRKWVILLSIIVTVAITAAASLLITPEYTATTTLRIATAIDKTMDYSSSEYVDRLMNTYTKILTSKPVLDEMMQEFKLAKPPEVKAQVVADTELISIAVDDVNPALARDIANALADVLIARSKGLYTGDTMSTTEILNKQLIKVQDELDQARTEYEKILRQDPNDTTQASALYQVITLRQQSYADLLSRYEEAQVSEALRSNAITIVEPATLPEGPSKPDLRLNLLVSSAVGVMVGIGLVFLFNSLDTTLYTTAQIKSTTGMPILGQIPPAKRKQPGIFFVSNSPQAEAFRRLRVNLHTLDHETPLRTLLVTSAEHKEGKTTVATNLAYALAQSKQKVLIMESELRLPTLDKIFDLPNEIGLSDVLKQEASLAQAVQDSKIPGLGVLTSGPLPTNPSELINSPQMITLLRQAAEQFDMVVLDTPALPAVMHSIALASAVDGVLLVVERAHTRQSTVWTACELLVNAKALSIGIVVNNAIVDSTETS